MKRIILDFNVIEIYYANRSEIDILKAHVDDIAAPVESDGVVIELGPLTLSFYLQSTEVLFNSYRFRRQHLA